MAGAPVTPARWRHSGRLTTHEAQVFVLCVNVDFHVERPWRVPSPPGW